MIAQHIARYSTIINAPIEKVWDAITNPVIIKKFFFHFSFQKNLE